MSGLESLIFYDRASTKRSFGSKRRATPTQNYHTLAPHLASAYALKGETERAAAELTEARRLSDGRYSSIAHLKAVAYFGVPNIRALYEASYFAGLRKAGMPEE
jgi:hypothetical protein